MPENNEVYSKLIAGLITALNKLSLYPMAHPAVKNALSQIHSIFKEVFASKKELTFSLSPENKILIEGQPVLSSATALLAAFVSEFKKLQAESITFYEGLTIEELEFFLKMMLIKSEDLKNQGGMNRVLTDSRIGHIKVNLFSYIKVEKDKELIALKNDRLKPAELNGRVKELLRGNLGHFSDQPLAQELHSYFLEKPKELSGLIKDIIVNAEELSKILDIIGDLAVKNSKDKDTKFRIDEAKAVAKFSSQLKKITLQFKGKGQSEELNALIDEKADAYADKILIDAVAAEYIQKKSWTANLKDIGRKFFAKSENKERVSDALKIRLSEYGLSEGEIGDFIIQFGKIAVSGAQVKSAKAETQELERLKNENADLKSEIENLKSESGKFGELKKQHQKIVEEKERVENIIRHMAEGLVVVDSAGKILLMNPAAEKLLDISKEQALGSVLREKIKDEHLLTFTKDLKPDKEGGLTQEIEFIGANEETKRVLRTSSAVVENQDGKTVGMVTILNDITKQKEIEKLKSDFVANVSHELRTPLVVIQQSLFILANEIKDKINEDQKKFLANSQTNLDRLRSLINDLLDMASIEAGKFKLKLGLFDINAVVRDVVGFLDRWAKTKNINLQAQLLPSKSDFFFDKDRIVQAITNLIGNAIKFTPEGGKIIVALAERSPDANFSCPAVEVCVADTGYGIEAKDLERIFNKFEQAVSIQDAGVCGTGLGLTITKEIVRMHKGKIWVESEVGKGSKFSFLLPNNQGEVKNE